MELHHRFTLVLDAGDGGSGGGTHHNNTSGNARSATSTLAHDKSFCLVPSTPSLGHASSIVSLDFGRHEWGKIVLLSCDESGKLVLWSASRALFDEPVLSPSNQYTIYFQYTGTPQCRGHVFLLG